MINKATIYCKPKQVYTIYNTEETFEGYSGYVATDKSRNHESAKSWSEGKSWMKQEGDPIVVEYSGESFDAYIFNIEGREQSGYTYKVRCLIDNKNIVLEFKSPTLMEILHSCGVTNGKINEKCIISRAGGGHPIPICTKTYQDWLQVQKKLEEAKATKDFVPSKLEYNIPYLTVKNEIVVKLNLELYEFSFERNRATDNYNYFHYHFKIKKIKGDFYLKIASFSKGAFYYLDWFNANLTKSAPKISEKLQTNNEIETIMKKFNEKYNNDVELYFRKPGNCFLVPGVVEEKDFSKIFKYHGHASSKFTYEFVK